MILDIHDDDVRLTPDAPEMRVSFASEADREESVARALDILTREGVVVLDDLVDPAPLATVKSEIEIAYPDYATPNRARNYGPYEGRHTMGLRVEGTLADRDILLPRPVAAIADKLLGDMFMVDSTGLLVANPGAPDQVRHPDGTLFPEVDLEYLLPPFAIAFAMPLVTMDEVTGRTAFWRKSHRVREAKGDHDFAPVVSPGSAILWDFRTKHCGLANTSDAPRPVLYSVLARYWWVEIHPMEATDYVKLQVPRGVMQGFSQRMQYRLRRAKLLD